MRGTGGRKYNMFKRLRSQSNKSNLDENAETSKTPDPPHSLPPGYTLINFSHLEPPSQVSGSTSKTMHKVSYTYMIKIRITPTMAAPYQHIFPEILRLIDKVSTDTQERKRILGTILWICQPSFMPRVQHGTVSMECFKTGKLTLNILTQDPTANVCLSTGRTECILGEYRSIELNISLFSNSVIEGPDLTGDAVEAKKSALRECVTYSVCSGPTGLCLDFTG